MINVCGNEIHPSILIGGLVFLSVVWFVWYMCPTKNREEIRDAVKQAKKASKAKKLIHKIDEANDLFKREYPNSYCSLASFYHVVELRNRINELENRIKRIDKIDTLDNNIYIVNQNLTNRITQLENRINELCQNKKKK